jgi:hypothetical protein
MIIFIIIKSLDTSTPNPKLGLDAFTRNPKLGVDASSSTRVHAHLGAQSHAHTQVGFGRVHAQPQLGAHIHAHTQVGSGGVHTQPQLGASSHAHTQPQVGSRRVLAYIQVGHGRTQGGCGGSPNPKLGLDASTPTHMC